MGSIRHKYFGKMHSGASRIVERLDALGAISDDEKCLSRFIGTAAHREAGKVLTQWMEMAGMEVTRDDVGNIRGILRAEDDNSKHFVIGSHYDTVFDAGKYDGPLGILLGIEVADRISKTENITLPFHLNVVAFTDDEGGRFNTTYFGSSALAGLFDSEYLKITDDDGNTVHDVLENNGGIVSKINDASIPKSDWLGYLEAHIEQGPVLCEENLSVCLVSSIAAQKRINVQWTGAAGHAGTCPMTLRQDALCAAAEFILAVESTGQKYSDRKLVATVGKLSTKPNSSNVIPGIVTHSIDLRAPDDELVEIVMQTLHKTAADIAKKRGLECDWHLMQSNPAAHCDEGLKVTLGRSISSHVDHLIEIPSGAGHDAVMISKVAPVAMLFVRCKDGISHNPAEYASPGDIRDALDVCNDFIEKLSQTNSNGLINGE